MSFEYKSVPPKRVKMETPSNSNTTSIETKPPEQPQDISVPSCILCQRTDTRRTELNQLKWFSQSPFLSKLPLEAQQKMLWEYFTETMGCRDMGDALHINPTCVAQHIYTHTHPVHTLLRDQMEQSCQRFYCRLKPKRSSWTGPKKLWHGHWIPERCTQDTKKLALLHSHPNDPFITMDEEDHLYLLVHNSQLKTMDASITQLISAYFSEFNPYQAADSMMRSIQKTRDGKPVGFPTLDKHEPFRKLDIWCWKERQPDGSIQTALLDEWKEGAEYRDVDVAREKIQHCWTTLGEDASSRGKGLHRNIELFLNDELKAEDDPSPEFAQFLKFHTHMLEQGYEIYRTEQIVYDTIGFAGMIDAQYILKGHINDHFAPIVIVDWKRIPNEKIHREGWEKQALDVAHTLGQRKLDHQILQLNWYQFLREKHYRSRVLDRLIVSMHESQPEFVSLPMPVHQTLIERMYDRFVLFVQWRQHVADKYQSID